MKSEQRLKEEDDKQQSTDRNVVVDVAERFHGQTRRRFCHSQCRNGLQRLRRDKIQRPRRNLKAKERKNSKAS